MKKIIALAFIFILFAVPASAIQMLVVTTSTAVGISSTEYTTANVRSSYCNVGPIETNAVRVTYDSSVTTSPTSTIGHELTDGLTLTLIRDNLRDEISTFRAIATSATSTVPVTCN